MKKDAFHDNGGSQSSIAAPRPSNGSFVVVLTDLDGTLLDHDTYEWKAAQSALDACRSRDVPVVLVSSKTRAEMDVVRRDLALSAPFVSENGGGVFFPRKIAYSPPEQAQLESDLWKWTLGSPYEDVVSALKRIRKRLHWKITGFADMSVDEICKHTGLDRASARLAAKREFDEPFLVEDPPHPDDRLLREAASDEGLFLSVGGRFRHLHGKSDKGGAVDELLAWYRRRHQDPLSVGLGDSPNDFPMLERVDIPILVRSAKSYPDLRKTIPRIRMTRRTGPAGWNEAVLDILGGG